MRLTWSLALLLPACATESPLFVSTTEGASSSGSSSGDDTGVPTTTSGPPPGTGESTDSGPPPTGSETSSSGGDEVGETSSSSSEGGEDTSASSSTGPLAPECGDGALNQDETDVDCGGAVCAACPLDAACLQDLDCASGWCDGGACKQPGCLVDSDCDMLDGPCLEASCDLESKACAVAPIKEGQACEDGDLCTNDQTCADGSCVGGGVTDCGALDSSCGLGVCDPQTGACVGDPFPGSEGDACDDGFVCTPDDACAAGLCGVGGPGYLFFEDFSDPDPAWELGPLWQFGAAVASESGPSGADPDSDHSPGADNKLAGTLIGMLIPEVAQAKTCLTSPEIDAGGQDELWLSYWRHLHTDYFPFAVHTIEAFDGDDWQVVETGFANPGVDDPAWTYQQHDISEHANEALRVRVCYSRTADAFVHAGWSLDDLTVGPYACTPEP